MQMRVRTNLPRLDTLGSMRQRPATPIRESLRYKASFGAADKPFKNFVGRLRNRCVKVSGYAVVLLFHVCLPTNHFDAFLVILTKKPANSVPKTI